MSIVPIKSGLPAKPPPLDVDFYVSEYVRYIEESVDKSSDILKNIIYYDLNVEEFVYGVLNTRFRVRTGKLLDRIIDTTEITYDGNGGYTITIPPTGRTHLSIKGVGYGPRYTPKNHGRQIITKLTPKGAYYQLTGDVIDTNIITNIIWDEIQAAFETIKIDVDIDISTVGVYLGPPIKERGIIGTFIPYEDIGSYAEYDPDSPMGYTIDIEGYYKEPRPIYSMASKKKIKESGLSFWLSYPRDGKKRFKEPEPVPFIKALKLMDDLVIDISDKNKIIKIRGKSL